MSAVPETPRQGGNDPSGFFASLERAHGAATLWGRVKDWIFYSDVLWDEREQCSPRPVPPRARVDGCRGRSRA